MFETFHCVKKFYYLLLNLMMLLHIKVVVLYFILDITTMITELLPNT